MSIGQEIAECTPPCPVQLCIEWSKVGLCKHVQPTPIQQPTQCAKCGPSCQCDAAWNE